MIIRYFKDTDYDDEKTNLIEGDIYYHVTDTKEKLNYMVSRDKESIIVAEMNKP